MAIRFDRRSVLAALATAPFARASAFADGEPSATFLFISDVHACQTGQGLSPHCQDEGKTDQALLRHVFALNALPDKLWPTEMDGAPTNLPSAGQNIGPLLGVVVGGDMTDDGGGQTAERTEGAQILQFSQRYHQGSGPESLRYPVYAGLGNHDLDQDGRPPDVDWYRDEMRDYVRMNHQRTAFFNPSTPVANYDRASDSYSWDWGPLHLVQLHRFGGDTRKGAQSALSWLKADLAAAGGKPTILFQHYGWDDFSTQKWDPAKTTYDDDGDGAPHWWSPQEQQQLLDACSDANVIALFHGHQHETPMIYRHAGLDVIKPKAAYLGGFALARLRGNRFEAVLGEAINDAGAMTFTNALTRNID